MRFLFLRLFNTIRTNKQTNKQTNNDKQQTTNNKQQTTNNKQQTTNNKQQTYITQQLSFYVCPELIKETGRFRKLIFEAMFKIPPSNKLRCPVEIYHNSPN